MEDENFNYKGRLEVFPSDLHRLKKGCYKTLCNQHATIRGRFGLEKVNTLTVYHIAAFYVLSFKQALEALDLI